MFRQRFQQSISRPERFTKHIVFAVCLALCAVAAVGQAQPGPLADGFSGKVVETMNAASYTYVLVNTGKKKLWAVAPRFDVKVGDTVAIAEGMPMSKYHSKTLKRTFDVVYFTGSVKVNGADAKAPAAPAVSAADLPKGHPPIAGGSLTADQRQANLPKGHPSIGGGKAQTPINLSDIKKAEGGKSIAEIYSGKDELKGKAVKVRGKVMKYNAEIMGKNWLHIQDGTGSAGSNDLTVTTKNQAKVGDTVLVTGMLATDRDFGAGYKYGLIIEDAKLVVE